MMTRGGGSGGSRHSFSVCKHLYVTAAFVTLAAAHSHSFHGGRDSEADSPFGKLLPTEAANRHDPRPAQSPHYLRLGHPATRACSDIERWWLARSRGREIRRLKTMTASQDLGEYHSCSFDETAPPLSTARIVHASPHCHSFLLHSYYWVLRMDVCSEES